MRITLRVRLCLALFALVALITLDTRAASFTYSDSTCTSYAAAVDASGNVTLRCSGTVTPTPTPTPAPTPAPTPTPTPPPVVGSACGANVVPASCIVIPANDPLRQNLTEQRIDMSRFDKAPSQFSKWRWITSAEIIGMQQRLMAQGVPFPQASVRVAQHVNYYQAGGPGYMFGRSPLNGVYYFVKIINGQEFQFIDDGAADAYLDSILKDWQKIEPLGAANDDEYALAA